MWELFSYSYNIVRFAQECEQEQTVNTPKVDTRKGNGITVLPKEDGSKSYFMKAHAFQLEQGIVLKWTKGYIGTVNYKDMRIIIEDGKGINIKVLK